jgi:sec-independent protein translocase protein TatA
LANEDCTELRLAIDDWVANTAARRREVVESPLFLTLSKGNAMLGRVGIPELLIILLIIILIFGANRLPEIGRGIGKGIKNFKEATKDGHDDKV